MKIRLIKFLFLGLGFILPAHAEVYMQVDQNGTAVYSDTPLSNSAQKVELPAPQTIGTKTPPAAPSEKNSATPNKEVPNASFAPPSTSPESYKLFQILSPKDQDSIQNQPTFTVQLKVEPKLQEGDRVQIHLDGKPWGTPEPSLQISLTDIDRGTHQISAVLLGQNGQILKQTPAITVYIHRAALGNASTIPRPNNGPPP